MLENKVGIIFGVANQRSIAWACADACAKQGAKMAFTYQGDRLKENVEKLTKDLDGAVVVPCDVTNQREVDAACETGNCQADFIFKIRDAQLAFRNY